MSDELKRLVDDLNSAFAEFKKTNDERMKALEGKGKADPLIEEKLSKIDTEINRLQEQLTKAQRLPQPGGKQLTEEQVAHQKAFGVFIRKGKEDGLQELERKAMLVGSDPDGGYFVPVDQSGRMIQRVFETSPMRQHASTATISTSELEGPTDLDEAASGWVGEAESRAETGTPQTGMWKIPVHEQYAEPRITQKLLDDAAFDVENWLNNKVADKFARQENNAFILGDGIKKPRGLFSYATNQTADATRAWGVFQSVKTGVNGNWPAANPADVLFDVIGTLKAAYRQGAVWVCPRSVVTAVRKFKDGQGQYLWQPGLQAGQPQMLAGYPVAEMEDVPAIANGSLSLGFGNLREAYQIVDRLGVRVLRDPYTQKPFVKFYTTKRTGGDVLNFEAFKFLLFSA